MSVENFEGNGLGDQPSIVYAFERGESGEGELRELCRSGFGSPGPSPGEIIERESTKSSPTECLPESGLPGEEGLQQPDCGDDLPAYSCASDDGCGNTVYVGRTCNSPACKRCWPSAVKAKAVRAAGKLEGYRRALYARYDGRRDIDFNQVVASLPTVRVDSADPYERILELLQGILEGQWGIEGFVVIYHPYRIKKEYRKDQYDHGGEAGEGEMTWKDVLNEENPYEYLEFEPHFHTFFPAVRGSFDYSVAEAVEEQSGWLFHRVTKGEESNVSVSDLSDLVHQLTYCFSHAGVRRVGPRKELMSRLKGELHECYIPKGVTEQVVGMFCEAAPKLLGVRFANLENARCRAEVSRSVGEARAGTTSRSHSHADEESSEEIEREHPVLDVWNPGIGVGSSVSGEGDPWPSGALDGGTGEGESGSSRRAREVSESSARAAGVESGEEEREDVEVCGGRLKPIAEAAKRLEEPEWCEQAEYAEGLRRAVAEWRRRTGGSEELPWTSEEEPEGSEGVIQDG